MLFLSLTCDCSDHISSNHKVEIRDSEKIDCINKAMDEYGWSIVRWNNWDRWYCPDCSKRLIKLKDEMAIYQEEINVAGGD